MDIMTGEKLSSIQVAISPVINWPGRLFCKREGGMGEFVIQAHYKFYLIREHENLL